MLGQVIEVGDIIMFSDSNHKTYVARVKAFETYDPIVEFPPLAYSGFWIDPDIKEVRVTTMNVGILKKKKTDEQKTLD